MFSKGDLSVPGFAHEDPKAGEDTLEALPPKPDLNILTYTKEDKDGNPTALKVPDSIVKQWIMHPEYKDDFMKFLDGFYDTFGQEGDGNADEREQSTANVPENDLSLQRIHAIIDSMSHAEIGEVTSGKQDVNKT